MMVIDTKNLAAELIAAKNEAKKIVAKQGAVGTDEADRVIAAAKAEVETMALIAIAQQLERIANAHEGKRVV